MHVEMRLVVDAGGRVAVRFPVQRHMVVAGAAGGGREVQQLLSNRRKKFLQQVLHARWPARIYALESETVFQTAMLYLGTIFCIAVPIKIWNDARIEHRVREPDFLQLLAH